MGLRRSRVDLLRGTLAVVEQLTEVDGALSFAALKTDASRRTIALPQFVIEELSRHIDTIAACGSLREASWVSMAFDSTICATPPPQSRSQVAQPIHCCCPDDSDTRRRA
jgi:hypothetical protein